MLIDMHAHTSGISHCCRATAAEVLATAAENGIEGLVITNHYTEAYVKKFGSPEALAKAYVEEYHHTRALAEARGMKAFFGIEVTMHQHGDVHLLVYGVEESFLLQDPTVYNDTQETLYRKVKAAGGWLIQAHPMRKGKNVLLDLRYLDGVEVNSHPLYDATHFDELSALAHANGKLLTSGGDYHADSHRAKCGVTVPNGLDSSKALMEYLEAADEVELCMQEPCERVCKYGIFKK